AARRPRITSRGLAGDLWPDPSRTTVLQGMKLGPWPACSANVHSTFGLAGGISTTGTLAAGCGGGAISSIRLRLVAVANWSNAVIVTTNAAAPPTTQSS